jgi:biopolymer transport protein ExbD
MSLWQARHQGSPKAVQGLSLAQIAQGLRDGFWAPTDEVMGPQDSDWVAMENHPQLMELVEDLQEPPARPREDETRLDMNALIDVTLVLLIFFILTTTRSVAVQKIIPLSSITESSKGIKVYQADQVKKFMVKLQAVGGADGAPVIWLEGKEVQVLGEDKQTLDKEKLATLIRPLVQGQPPKTEMLLDAQKVSWGTVVAIQDAAKAAGIRVVHHWQKKPGGK